MTYAHKEAYCLMQYQDEVTGEIEILWNSRDGVTPFMIISRRGNTAKHVNWKQDICCPDFKPAPGMRIFVTATEQLVRPGLLKYIDQYWAAVPYALRDLFSSREEAYQKLLPDWYDPKRGIPYVTEAA